MIELISYSLKLYFQEATAMIDLTLPIPPSANRYWRNVRGRTIVSKDARQYKEAAGWTAKAAGAELLDGDVAMEAHVYRPQKRGDLDNYTKILSDSLEGICYANDSQIVELHLYRHDDKDDPRVEVKVWQSPGVAAALRDGDEWEDDTWGCTVYDYGKDDE